MAKERAVIEAPGLEIRVHRGPQLPSWEDGSLTIGDLTLEADVKIATLAWNAAILLAAPIRFHRGDKDWARRIIADARSRLLAAALSEVKARLGPLARIAARSPLLPPALAMHHYPWYSCIWEESLDGAARRYMRRYYSKRWLRLLHDGPGGGVAEAAVVALLPRLASIARVASTMLVKPPGSLGSCSMPQEAENPWSLVRLPEGSYMGECSSIWGKLGVGGCRRPVIIGGSRVCESRHGVIVVKDYYWMGVKWLPGFIASARVYGFRLGAKSRMAAEAYYMPRLRGIVETPRVIALCSERYKALMARTFLEGRPVQESESSGDWAVMGEALAAVHRGGYTLGDPNPGNFLVGDYGVAVIDAEQARRYKPVRAAWDLAEMALMGLFYGARERLVRAAVEGYLARAPRDVLDYVLDSSVWVPLAPLQPFASSARRIIEEAYKLITGPG